MSTDRHPTSLNNTPDVLETVAADAPAKKIEALHHRPSRGVVREWWWLRITAALLVPLNVWFMVALVTHLLCVDPVNVAGWLKSPLNVALMSVMLVAGFIHTRLGVHEMILDYTKGGTKKALNLLVDLLSLGLGVASIAAIIHLHMAA